MKTVSLRIKGRVQGVGFRYFVLKVASKLGVNGIVRNCSNGDVYIEAECNSEVLIQFIDKCQEGTLRSIVEDIEITEIHSKDYSDFEIIE